VPSTETTAKASVPPAPKSPSLIAGLLAKVYATDPNVANELAKAYGADLTADVKANAQANAPKLVDTGDKDMILAAAKALNNASDKPPMPFDTEKGFPENQIVTYSTRSVQNISDIVDALNISSSASIKYGTISGNASCSFVNEDKVNDSDINYILTVKVCLRDGVLRFPCACSWRLCRWRTRGRREISKTWSSVRWRAWKRD
jgi:hypothetical protein